MTTPGNILLLGSGETSPSIQNSYSSFFQPFRPPVKIAILETPAGFEPNSAYVVEQIGKYFEKRLQNYQPQISLVPARKRGSNFSPDDTSLLAPLYAADVLLMGPGSPSYAVRQLQESAAWHTLRACHRLGAALIFASASVLAISAHTLPVYEIYKVGEDLHWKPGLNLFADFGLNLVFVPHWNNSDGGAVLDTSRCYMGQDRFAQLLQLLSQKPPATVLGIDENTALLIDLQNRCCQVMGSGGVTVICPSKTSNFAAGSSFAVEALGDFRLSAPGEGLPAATISQVQQAKEQLQATNQPNITLSEEVQSLVNERAQARAAKNWALADQLRATLADLGWRVVDSSEGQQVEKI